MPRKNEEENDAIALASYLKLRGLMFSHIAQETPAGSYQEGVWRPNWKTIKRNQAMGVTKGVPDFIILLNSWPKNNSFNFLLFIELKKKKGGVVSLDQKTWIDGINSTRSAAAYVARGFDEAKRIVDNFIN